MPELMELIATKKLAQHLGVRLPTVYSWVNRGMIPHYKIGRCLLFNQEEITEWLEKKKVEVRG